MVQRALSATRITHQPLEIPAGAFKPRSEEYLRNVGVDPDALPNDPRFASVRVAGMLQRNTWNIAVFDARLPVTTRQERPLGKLALPNAFVPEQAAAQTEQWVRESDGVADVVTQIGASLGNHEQLHGHLLVVKAGVLAVQETDAR